MPAAEIVLEVGDVSDLVAEQCPNLAGSRVTAMAHGWDNALYRIGDENVARFPRRALAVPLVQNEIRWLPELAPHLPLPIPVPWFIGRPSTAFPWPWTIVPWLAGESAATASLDVPAAARSLGEFLRHLHRLAPNDAPENPYRGMHVAERDEVTTQRLQILDGEIDATSLGVVWAELSSAEPWSSPPVWLHGDFHPHNLLVEQGVPSGVVDFGDLTSGDPATDLSIGWMLFDRETREMLFESYGGVDQPTRARAAAWALSLATAYLGFGSDSPVMTSIGRRAFSELLADRDATG